MDSGLVTQHRQGTIAKSLLECFPGVFLFFTVYLPVGTVLFTNLSDVPSMPFDLILGALKISFLQALFSAFISGLLGVFLAVVYVDSGIKIARVFGILSLICFSLPTLIVCLALMSFWGKSGWFGGYLHSIFGFEFYGWFGVLCAHTFMNFSLFFRSVVERLSHESRVLEKAALRLGASRFQTFLWITWPKIEPAVRNSALLVFVYCFTSFLAVLLLGGGPRFSTLEVLIYQAIRLDGEITLAGVLSLVQLVFCLFAFGLIRKAPVQTKSGERLDYQVYRCRTYTGKLFVCVLLGGILLFVAGPLCGLVLDGLAGVPALVSYEVVFVTLRGIVLALAVGCMSVLVGGGAAYAVARTKLKKYEAFLKIGVSLPLVLSSILLSMALFQLYGGLEIFRDTLVGPFLIQVLVATPVVARVVSGGIQRMPPMVLNAATALGSGFWQRLCWIEGPLLRSSFRLAFVLSVCLSLGEVGSLLMFAVGGDGVLPMWIYRQMGRYHFQEAAAGSLLLLLVLFVFFKGLGSEETSG